MEDSASSDELLKLSGSILHLARTIHLSVDGPLQAELGLTTKDLLVLGGVIAGSSRPGQIASRLNMAAPSVSRHLDRLIEMGLLTRELDSGDRRGFRLTATGEGRERYQRSRDLATGLLRQRYREVPDGEIRRAIEVLDTLIDQLKTGREATRA